MSLMAAVAFLFVSPAGAQVEQDTTKSALYKIEARQARLDSAGQKLDSLSGKTNDAIGRQQARIDSVENAANKLLDKPNELTGKVNTLGDSISPKLSRYSQKLDSIKGRLRGRIDSLNRLGQPTQKYTRLLDSLNQSGPFKQIDKAEQKITDLQRKVSEPGNRITQSVNEKLAIMNKEGGSEAGIPGQVALPGVGVPGLNQSGMPGVGVPAAPGVGVPDGGIGGLAGPDVGLGGISVPSAEKLDLPGSELGNIGELDELEKAQGALGKVSEVTGQAKQYSDEIKNVKEGGLNELESAPKAIENQVTQREELQGMQGDMAKVDEVKEMVGKGNDKDAMKEMAAKEVKKKAVDHFAGKGEQLKNAMQRVSTMKQKYSSIKSIKDLQKRPPNPMKGKPLIERLVPGLVTQFQSSEHFLLDLNPVLGYRFGGKVNAGVGWNHRLAIGSRLRIFPEERIYGPRVYGELKFGKGFAARTDIEKMNTFIPPLGLMGPTDGRRDWVWSVFVGLKKEYKLSKHVEGNFQFLYNLYDDHDNSPYADRLVVRTGFEFPQKKKYKKKK